MRNWFLPAVMAILGFLSILTLKSVSPQLAAPQFIFFCLGFAVFFVVSRLSYQQLEQKRWLIYAGLCVLLVIPLLIGKTTRGIAGWIDIGTLFSIQPSQLAVLGVGLLTAKILEVAPPKNLKRLVWPLAVVAIPAVLIVIEPDLGTTVIYIAAFAVMLFVSPIPSKYLVLLGIASLASLIIGWNFLKPYQQARITSFVGTSTNQDASYNAQQALIAVGSGQVVGRGIGQGSQSHLRFLPERQTDFIFASLAEELGFFGGIIVISLYAGVVLFCIRVGLRAHHLTERYFCMAAATMIMVQAGINIGMNMSILPITGVTLPLLSYGGSSILTVCALFGVIQSINLHSPVRGVLHIS
ncbi:MAG: rod shape-determining protein RodA [bacterium]|nr:rod shape-determining protein RodA [bacterium]